MSDPTNTHRTHRLTGVQESFVSAVMAAAPPACHVLLAPMGTGKGTAAVEIVARLARTHPSIRALILCPAALVQQFATRLALSSETLRVDTVDRQRYRELDAAASMDGSPFAPSTVAILSIDLAKHADVTRGLLATHWDLLVVDEAHGLSGQRGLLVQQLVDSGRVDRAIFMSASPIEGLILPRALVSRWASDALPLDSHWASRSLQSVAVPYTEAEQVVFGDAAKLAEEFAQAGFPEISKTLRSRAYSSFYSLERILRTLRNRAAHGGFGVETEVAGGEDGRPEAASMPRGLIDRVELLLAAMDEVAVDSKTEALCALLAARLSAQDTPSAIIVSAFASTVEYLTATLSDRGMNVRAATGHLPPKDLAAVVGAVASPGITVMTFAAMDGLEVPPVGSWVFYEKTAENRHALGLVDPYQRASLISTGIFEFDPPHLDRGS